MLFPDSAIRELANNTYDYLFGGYEMWIKDPQLGNDKPSISRVRSISYGINCG